MPRIRRKPEDPEKRKLKPSRAKFRTGYRTDSERVGHARKVRAALAAP